jgi:hypothetical protein
MAAYYEIQITATDSANPPQTDSETLSVKITQPQTQAKFPTIPIVVIALSAVGVGAFISIRKKRLNGQNMADKLPTAKTEEQR